MTRLNTDDFFMTLAVDFAAQATCNRLKVGTVLTKGKLLLSEGYNGSIAGHEHCIDVGCLLNDEGRCIRTLHSEVNAILNAVHKGVSVVGATAYVTAMPCEGCSKILAQSGISKIVYLKDYPNKYNHHFLSGIELEEFSGESRDALIEKINLINKK